MQQEIHGHRGRKNDPLYGIRTILRCGQEKLTDRQRARLDRAIAADQRHDEILVAWLCAQKLRSAYRAKSPAEGRRIADDLIRSLPTFPMSAALFRSPAIVHSRPAKFYITARAIGETSKFKANYKDRPARNTFFRRYLCNKARRFR